MKELKEDWQEIELDNIISSISETYKKDKKNAILINTSDVLNGKVLNHSINKGDIKGQFKKSFKKNDILYSEIRPINRRFAFVDFDATNYIASTKLMVLRVDSKYDTKFIYNILKSNDILIKLQTIAELRSGTFPQITFNDLKKIKIKLPPLKEQKKIASILSSLDDKIELNNRMNKILEETAQTIFKEWFINFNFPNEKGKHYKKSGGKMIESELGEIPEGWEVDILSNIFDISIGKTPPRKETECFSNNDKDMKWVSISDMGKSGLYLLDTSEYLTLDAVNKYNVIIVPKDTIILSFKLTIGRVSIVSEDMTTNEAIAHIKTNNKKLNEYTYFYLKNFKYSTLGSTSSIAQAVNSKLIKSIKFILPDTNILNDFHLKTKDIFNKIKYNQIENQKLAGIRDSILPKLMSGEIRIK